MPCEVTTTREAGALVLTFADVAHRNRLDTQACVAAIEALNTADSDETLRAVILRGHGSHFCAGAAADTGRALGDLLEGIAAYPKAVLAAIEGEASGAGWALALAADAQIAAEGALFRLGEPLLPGLAHQLAALLPRPLAWTALWQGEALDAATLHAAGALTRYVQGGEALAAARLEVARLLARDGDCWGEFKHALRRAPVSPWLPIVSDRT